jgi:hypothetical protein
MKSHWRGVSQGRPGVAISDTTSVGTHADARRARGLCSGSHHFFEYIDNNTKGGFCDD